MKNKKIIGIIGLVAVVAIGAMLASYGGFVGNVVLSPISGVTFSSSPSGEGIKYGSIVCVYHNDEMVFCKPNTLTIIGRNATINRISGFQTAPFNYIAVGNLTAVNVTTTFLEAEIEQCGLARAQDATMADIGTGNWSYSYKFTSTCDSIKVNTTALYNNSAVSEENATFAGATFSSPVTLQANDELNVTWFVFVVT